MAGTAGKYDRPFRGNPATASVDVHAQPTQRDNGTNPSNKHWKSKPAGPPAGGPPLSGQNGGMAMAGTSRVEHLNAGATKRFGGNTVKSLGG